ncbi:MAG: ABC transporter ATP-binding protein [Gammaproteobacteria bacterium]|nr:ABC transporter ATP-binding protein [Gammaproteobacteria bacterium]
MISLKSIEFAYPQQANLFQGIDLEIISGSLFGLLGPNGAGKTTLIALMTGQLKPCAGEIHIQGLDYRHDRKRILSNLAVAPQDYAFYPQLTARENLDFFSNLYPQIGAQRKARIQEALELTGLQDQARKPARQFSGGLKRRLNLAISLLNRPAILFLDEPTVGIDPQSRHFILQAIRDLNRSGTTILYTSHYMEEVEQLCDRVAIIDHGRILAHDGINEILNKPARLQITFDTPTDSTSLPASLKALLQKTGFEYANGCLSGLPRDTHAIHELLKLLEAEKLKIQQITYGRQTLESLFFELTQTHLRD